MQLGVTWGGCELGKMIPFNGMHGQHRAQPLHGSWRTRFSGSLGVR